MKIHRAVDRIDLFLAEEFDLFRLACSGACVLGNKQADPLAEALDVLALLHQDSDGSVEMPISRSGRLGAGEADH